MKFQPHATGTFPSLTLSTMCEQLLDNIESKMKGTVVEVRFSSTLCHTRALVYLYLNLLLLQGTIAGLFEGKMEVGSSCMYLWLMWLPETVLCSKPWLTSCFSFVFSSRTSDVLMWSMNLRGWCIREGICDSMCAQGYLCVCRLGKWWWVQKGLEFCVVVF